MNQLIYGSATALAKAIRSFEVSSKEVLECYLERIIDVNPKLNAVVQLVEDTARSQAIKADEALARGDRWGPLHGVPMTIKDSFDTAGVVTTGGTKGRAGFVPHEDASVVSRLRNAGAAAIVAAGGSAFDIGSDYGGSLRYPSHCCGISTIKPTSGRVPRTGHILPFGGVLDKFQQIGPIARYVEDLNLILPLISGPDWIDPGIVEMPLGDPDRVDFKRLKIAFHTDNGICPPSLETAQIVRQAAKYLDGEGLAVEEAVPAGIEQSYELMIELLSADGGASIQRLLKQAGTKDHTLPWLGLASPIDATSFDALMMKWVRFQSMMLSFLKDFDVILCPVNAYPAQPHGTTGIELEAFSYTMTYNMMGWPSAVVRGGSSLDGLPIGLQIVARPWREDVALAVAGVLEKELGGYQSPSI